MSSSVPYDAFTRPSSKTPSRAHSLKPQPRLPLITPSASPPISRPAETSRFSDGPSPTKKRRISSTPSSRSSLPRSSSVGVPSSSSSPFTPVSAGGDYEEDLHNARHASSLKVLSIWAQLEQKYARTLEEDDIVDLRDITVIKDRGVLSSSDGWEIGCFGDEENQAQTDVDDDIDELDAFSTSRPGTPSQSEIDEAEQLGLNRQRHNLPPVQVFDPADADDLKEFLEMERLRREAGGDSDEPSDRELGGLDGDESVIYEQEEEESVQEVEITLGDRQDSSVQVSRDGSESPQLIYVDTFVPTKGAADDDVASEDLNELESVDLDDKSEEPLEVAHVDGDEESEDELEAEAWVQDEGTIVYAVDDSDDESEGGEDIQVVEEVSILQPDLPSPSEDDIQEIQPSALTQTAATEPSLFQQASSSRESEKQRPVAPRADLPQPSLQNIRKKRSLLPHENIQLHTPPRSTSSRPDNYDVRILPLKDTPERNRALSSKTASDASRGRLTPASLTSLSIPGPSRRLIAEVVLNSSKMLSTQSTSIHRQTSSANVAPAPDNEGPSGRSPHAPTTSRSSKAKEKESVDDGDAEGEPISPRQRRKLPELPSPSQNQNPLRKMEGTKAVSRDVKPLLQISQKRQRSTSESSIEEVTIPAHRKSTTTNSQTRGRSRQRDKSEEKPLVSAPRSRETNEYSSGDDEPMAGPSSSSPLKSTSSHRSSRRRKRSSSQLRDCDGHPLPPEHHDPSHPHRSSFSNTNNEQLRATTPSHAQYVRQQTPSHIGVGAGGLFGNVLQDPNAQFYLAHALHTLSMLMSGGAAVPPTPTGQYPGAQFVQASHMPHPMQTSFPPFMPITPTHHQHHQAQQMWTPSSAASAPPTSSPIRSEMSSPRSSPSRSPSPRSRQPSRARSRSRQEQTQRSAYHKSYQEGHSHQRSHSRSRSRSRSRPREQVSRSNFESPPREQSRPRSVLRSTSASGERSTPGGVVDRKGKGRALKRRVSFSEPEAVDIEDGEKWTSRRESRAAEDAEDTEERTREEWRGGEYGSEEENDMESDLGRGCDAERGVEPVPEAEGEVVDDSEEDDERPNHHQYTYGPRSASQKQKNLPTSSLQQDQRRVRREDADDDRRYSYSNTGNTGGSGSSSIRPIGRAHTPGPPANRPGIQSSSPLSRSGAVADSESD